MNFGLDLASPSMWLFALSLPFFYSASYVLQKSIKLKMLNIDILIALGIIIMFIRSTIDIVFNYGSDSFDSQIGLIFLCCWKMFQIKLYKPSFSEILNPIFQLQF
jgi:Cu+-exporting ATPase